MSNVVKFPEPVERDATTPRGPQVEDGYTRIANELLESMIAAPLTLREMRAALGVIRLTYGQSRKASRVTGGLLAEVTGLSRTNASSALAGLLNKRIVVRLGGCQAPVSINTNADQWCPDNGAAVWTYLVRNVHTGHIKIGISKTPRVRIKSISKAVGAEIEVLGLCAENLEDELHTLFDHLRLEGEWFQDPKGEIETQARQYTVPEDAL